MNGFCGYFSSKEFKIDETKFQKSINLTGNLKVRIKSGKNFLLATSYHRNSVLTNNPIYETKRFTYLFTGDLIYHSQIPWNEIVLNFEKENYIWFSKLRGRFAFAIIDRLTEKIYLITDHLKKIPIYYGFLGDEFIFSTDISTFFLARTQPVFDPKWLYEYIFFGFPIDTTSFLSNIHRIRPNTVLRINLINRRIDSQQYKTLLGSEEQTLTFDEAVKEAIVKFGKIIPDYFSKDRKNLIALTGGFDSRMLLSQAPKGSTVISYTYGMENCGDLVVAKRVSKKIKIEHKEILFNEKFNRELPNLIYDVVRLSGGTQPIIRATLLYVYKQLYAENDKQTVPLIGGIGGDFFRGMSEHVRPMVTQGLVKFFDTGKIEVDKNDYYFNVFEDNYNEFESHIKKSLNKITELYGLPKSVKTFMAYDIYEINSNYFGGEMSIANNYFLFRLPYLDHDLLKFGLRTPFNSEEYNPFKISSKKIGVKKYFIQAKVMCKIRKIAFTYIRGVPLITYTIRNDTLFKITKFFIRGWSYVLNIFKNKTGKSVELEDWDSWFRNELSDELDKLLNENSLVNEYVSYDFIKQVREKNSYEMLSKFATTEIILRLMKEKWKL